MYTHLCICVKSLSLSLCVDWTFLHYICFVNQEIDLGLSSSKCIKLYPLCYCMYSPIKFAFECIKF